MCTGPIDGGEPMSSTTTNEAGAKREHRRPEILVEPVARRLTVHVDGVIVADTTAAVVLTEGRLPPRHYLPAADVHMSLLSSTDTSTHCPWKGDASYWSVTVNGTTHPDIVWSYPDPIAEMAEIAGFMSFYAERDEVDLAVT